MSQEVSLEHELAAGVFLCVNCGAQVTFSTESAKADESLLEQSACDFCEVVNDRALAELRKSNALTRHKQRMRSAGRKKIALLGGAVLASVLTLAGIAASNTADELSAAHEPVEAARAQVINVRERQVAVVARYANAAPGPERDAELSGSENRVRIERARYDQAAAAYNALVISPWPSFCAAAFDLPNHVEMSNVVEW